MTKFYYAGILVGSAVNEIITVNDIEGETAQFIELTLMGDAIYGVCAQMMAQIWDMFCVCDDYSKIRGMQKPTSLYLSGRTILYNLTSFVAGGTATRVLSAVALFLIARQIGEGAYGRYAPSLATATLASLLFTMGLHNWILYRGGKRGVAEATTLALFTKTVIGGIWIGGIALLSRSLNPETYSLATMVWAAVSIWLEELNDTIWSGWKVDLRNDWCAVLMTLFHGSFLLFVIIGRRSDAVQPETYLMVRAIAAACAFIITLIWHTRHYAWAAVSWTQIMSMVVESKLFWVSAALSVIYARADLTIIAQLMGNEASSQYAPASSLINALFILPAAGYNVLIPILVKQNEVSERGGQKLLMIASICAIVAGGIAGGLIWSLSEPLLAVSFGEKFSASGDILRILGWVFTLKCVSMTFAAGIVAGGYHPYRVWVQLVAAVFNVGATLIAALHYDTIVVALVYVATECLLLLGYGLLLYIWWRNSNRNRLQTI